jgi:hypothetical protein
MPPDASSATVAPGAHCSSRTSSRFFKEQRNDIHARALAIWNERHLVGVDAYVRAVGQIELPELYKNRKAEFRAGRVLRFRRIADVTARREVAVLILEDAL